MGSAHISHNLGTKHAVTIGVEPLSVALIGPDAERRTAMAKALAETRLANVRAFNSYPPGIDHLQRLLRLFDVIILDSDSNPDVALELVERASASDAATIMVYSENADQNVAVRFMRAGAREYLLLPLEQGDVAEALARSATNVRENVLPTPKTLGDLLVFVGSKGGCGVTTVACNVAIALAQNPGQSTLLIDLALPIGDAALCLGIAADYSTEDALRNIDRLDATSLQNLLVQHRSGVFVLAAPTKVPEVEVSKGAIEKLIAVARREFDHVIVDVGSRIDVVDKVLFEDASTVFLVTQTGISELRNSNRLISQFFSEGNPNLEIVINRAESRFLEAANEDVIAKALDRPVRWKIPDDQDAARALQYGETGLADTRISRISLEMANSIGGRPAQEEEQRDFNHKTLGRSFEQVDSGTDDQLGIENSASNDAGSNSPIRWPRPEPIAYGEKLSTKQLNATASVAGTFVYTPRSGYVLPVGTHTLWVTFTPADSDSDSPLQANVTIVVTKATPALNWPTPAEISFGTALDDTQLNASAPTPGKFEYSPGRGEILPPGTHTLSVTFTPTDTANYTTAQATVSVTIAKGVPVLQWPTPDPIIYGTQLTAAQLCAASSVSGRFDYNPGPGAVLAAGVHNLSVTFNPANTSDYSPSQSAVSLTVAKATPGIAWSTPDSITYGVALSSAQLNAAATIPGSLSYAPAAGEILPPGVHKLSVSFTPTDTLNYTTTRAVVSITVTEKLPTHINWPAPSAISYGTALSAAQLNAAASVPGTFVYTPAAGHVLAPGRYTLSASFTPSDTEKYATAQAAVVLEVEGLKDIASSMTGTSQSQATRNSSATHSAAADSAPEEAKGERTNATTSPRETRTYKGAVYEKGPDGKWHLLTE